MRLAFESDVLILVVTSAEAVWMTCSALVNGCLRMSLLRLHR